MGVIDSVANLVSALRGISTYAPARPMPGVELGDVRSSIEAMGGQLEPMPQVRLRWYPPDIERAQHLASTGEMIMVGQLCESMNLDGVIRGLSDARTSVANFPRRFYGATEIVNTLQSRLSSDRSVYQEMIPATEKRLMISDGIRAGVAVGTMMPVRGRSFPVLIRRYVQNLWYLWSRDQWYYRSIAGNIPINPGVPDSDGNVWILHIPGGRLAPWNSGLWNTLGRSYINKTQTTFARQAYEMRHSQPGRFMTAAMGSTQEEKEGAFQFLIRWAMNAASVLPPGWDVKLVESNGQGIKVYEASIAYENMQIATALCGSATMLEGTVGFGNIDVFKVVTDDLMKSTASGWDHTENTQILPAFIGHTWGVEALADAVTVETDVAKPTDRASEANSMVSLANAVKGLVEAVALAQRAAGETSGVTVNVRQLLADFGVPTTPAPDVGLALPEKTTEAKAPEAEPAAAQ